jgi:hypothetical protein
VRAEYTHRHLRNIREFGKLTGAGLSISRNNPTIRTIPTWFPLSRTNSGGHWSHCHCSWVPAPWGKWGTKHWAHLGGRVSHDILRLSTTSEMSLHFSALSRVGHCPPLQIGSADTRYSLSSWDQCTLHEGNFNPDKSCQIGGCPGHRWLNRPRDASGWVAGVRKGSRHTGSAGYGGAGIASGPQDTQSLILDLKKKPALHVAHAAPS